MRTVLIAALLLLVSCRESIAQQTQQAQQTTVPPKPDRIELLIEKTVVFITLTVNVGGTEVPGYGTGFLVAFPDDRLAPGQGFVYLVTNRHVAEAIEVVEGSCKKFPIIKTSFTWNRRDPSNLQYQHSETVASPATIPWVFPDDNSVDLAIIPVVLDPDKDDVKFVGVADFMANEQIGKDVDVGDRILFAGLFAPFQGEHRVQPLLRQGMLAMRPDGRINTTLCAPGDVYLADVHAIQGNSGSPVFITPRFTLGGMVGNREGVVPYGLLGVISGYMNDNQNFILQAATTTFRGSLQANSDVAIIVPAYQVKALLESAPLKQKRDEYVAALKAIKR
jgi:hypothetical protein